MGLAKRYGDHEALRPTDLQIEAGEYLTLLGPSGSGKTTVLMLLAGFVAPSAGDLRLDGRSILGLAPEARGFGVVFQGYALFPHLSVRDNVAFPLRLRRWSRDATERAVARALDLTKLAGLGDRLPRQLSGGQQQRVALARALVFDPPLLLLDEPMSALDKALKEELQAELKELHRRVGSTFVHVTHDQEEALALSDRIAVLRQSRLEQVGTPQTLYHRPANRFVAGFLGRSNLLAGQVERCAGGVATLAAGGVRFRQRLPDDGSRVGVGGTLAVAVKPDRLRAGTEPGDAAGGNHVAGVVLSSSFRGRDQELRVETTPFGTLLVRRDGTAPLPAAGEPVILSWAADDGVAVDD